MSFELFDVDDVYILKNICVSSQCYTKAGQLRDIEKSFNKSGDVGQTKVSLDIQKMIKDINYDYRNKNNRRDSVIVYLIDFFKKNHSNTNKYFFFLKEVENIFYNELSDDRKKDYPLFGSFIKHLIRKEKLKLILNEEI